MKKVMMTLLLVAAFGVNSFAQKGMNGIGINVPAGVYDGFKFLGIGVKYQYNISNYFRIEPSFEYSPIYSKKDYKGMDDYDYVNMKAFLNGHLFLMSPRPVRPYVLLGAGFTQWGCAPRIVSGRKDTEECFAYNAGLGCDFRLSHRIGMQIEATAFSSARGNGTTAKKYTEYNKDHYGKWCFLGRIGFTYTF